MRTSKDILEKEERFLLSGVESPFHLSGSLLGSDFSLETDDPAFLHCFQRFFSELQIGGAHFSTGKSTLFRVILQGAAHPLVEIETSQDSICFTRSLSGHPHPALGALHVVVQELMCAAEGFFIAHASVVADEDRAMLLCGPSGIGKTTLSLTLADHGLDFLSDDYCPFHLESGLVHPFPRSVLVKRPLPTSHRSSETGRANTTVATPHRTSVPRRPGVLICLESGFPEESDHQADLLVHEFVRPRLHKDLRGISPEILVEYLEEESRNLRLRYPRAPGLTKAVKEILHRHREGIWHTFRCDSQRPDFSQTPTMSPITVQVAALTVLRETRQMPEQVSETGFQRKSAGALLLRIVGLLDGVACYRMRVGNLEEMNLLALQALEGHPRETERTHP